MNPRIFIMAGRWTFTINLDNPPPLLFYMNAKRWCTARNRKEGRL